MSFEHEQQMFILSEYWYNIITGIYGAGKGWDPPLNSNITCKTRLKSSRKHQVFPSYSAMTNFLEPRNSNEVTRFPRACNISVLVSSFHILLTNTLLENNDLVVSNTCTLWNSLFGLINNKTVFVSEKKKLSWTLD